MLDKLLHTVYIRQKNLKDLLSRMYGFIEENDGKVDVISIEIKCFDYEWHANIYYEIV